MQVKANKFQKQMLTKFKITQILELDRCAIAKQTGKVKACCKTQTAMNIKLLEASCKPVWYKLFSHSLL